VAEIEYGGIKIGGTKLLLIVPLIGTLLGGLWGGFELFSRYKAMEEQISLYVAPDISEIEKLVAVFQKETTNAKDLMMESRNQTREDIATLYKNLDKQDLRNRSNVESVREMITAFEGRLADKVARLDSQQDDLESKLDLRIKRALENPLMK
jgi:hypothetical protein|tara:strand:- start:584 stop:1039 length:456 start_codon:yes stop_codon:yes gene_type:complete